MTNTTERFHERLKLEHKHLTMIPRPDHYFIGAEEYIRVELRDVPNSSQQDSLNKELPFIIHWTNEKTILTEAENEVTLDHELRDMNLPYVKLPVMSVTAYEKAGNKIMTDVEDAIDYFNRCLNEKQKHDALVHVALNDFMTPVENLDETTELMLNPYTGHIYGAYDLYSTNMDSTFQVFLLKLHDMSEDDAETVVNFIKFAAIMQYKTLFDSSTVSNYLEVMKEQARDLSILLYDITNSYKAEAMQMSVITYDQLREAVRNIEELQVHINAAASNKDKTLYEESKDPRLQPIKYLSFDELIEHFNTELSKKEQTLVYELLCVGRATNTVKNEDVLNFIFHVKGLPQDEREEFDALLEFWHKANIPYLINMQDKKAAGKGLTEQADCLLNMLTKSYEHFKLKDRQDEVLQGYIGNACMKLHDISHLIWQTYKHDL